MRSTIAALFLLLTFSLEPALADIAPRWPEGSVTAADAAEDRKLATCSPRSEQEHSRYGRSTVYRQVAYDLLLGEVNAATSELRRALAHFMQGRAPAMRACMPSQAELKAPERLSATVQFLLLGSKIQTVVAMSSSHSTQPNQPSIDLKCLEKALASDAALSLRNPTPNARASTTVQYVPFCVISREYEGSAPSSGLGFGSGKSRFPMPEHSPTTAPGPSSR